MIHRNLSIPESSLLHFLHFHSTLAFLGDPMVSSLLARDGQWLIASSTLHEYNLHGLHVALEPLRQINILFLL